MKKVVGIVLTIVIMMLSMEVKACELNYEEYTGRGIVQSFVVGEYIFNTDNGYSPSLEDFAEAARSIKDGEEVKIYNIMMVGDIYYKVTEVFSNESTTDVSKFPKIDVSYEYRASIRGAKEKDYDVITCKNKGIRITYTGMYTEGSGEYKTEAIRYASIQSSEKITGARYCKTINEECIPDEEIEVNGSEVNVKVNFETNVSAQKVCISATTESGESEIKCDTEKVKVDKTPIKIEDTNVLDKTIEGKPANLENMFEVTYSVSGGNLEYFSYQEDKKTMISDLSELKEGKATIELMARSGSGLISECSTDIEVVKNEVTYDYETNGGTSVSKKQDKVIYNGKADLTVMAVKEGYTFVGWSEDPYAHIGITTKVVTEDVTLYAIFKKDIEASFEINSQNGEIPAVSEYEKTSCEVFGQERSCKIKIPSINAKMGYKVKGWSKEKNKTESDYVGGEEISIEKNETYYSVTYEKNPLTATIYTYTDGKVKENNLKCYKYNGEASCKIDISTLKNDAYLNTTHVGYTKDKEVLVNNIDFEITKGETYYSYYEKISHVTFVGATKTDTDEIKTWYVMTENGVKSNLEEKDILKQDDYGEYRYVGYRVDEETDEATIKGEKYQTEEDKIYNAIYEKEVTLSYVGNEGETKIPASVSKKIYYNAGNKKESYAEIKLDDGTISKANNIFSGWSDGKNTYSGGETIRIKENTSVKPIWSENGCKVIFDYETNGGTSATKSQEIYNYETSEAIDLSKIKAYKPGWEFIGWSKYEDSTSTNLTKFIPEEGATEVKLYAIYRKVFTVSYKIRDTNAYTLSSEKQVKYTMYNKEEKTDVTLSRVINISKRYTFLGWSKSEESETAEYNEGETITLGESTTIYGVVKDEETVKVNYIYYEEGNRKTITKYCNRYNGRTSCETESGISGIKHDEGILIGWSDKEGEVSIQERQINENNKNYYAVYDKLLTVVYNSQVNKSVTSTEVYKINMVATNDSLKYISIDLELDTPDAVNGYKTLGWRVDEEADKETYKYGETVSIDSSKVYNGVYKKEVTLSYDELGGKEKIIPETKTIYYNTSEASEEKYISFNVNGITSKVGYSLNGWKSGSAVLKNGEEIKIKENTRLVADWKALKYKITYDYATNGGTSISVHPDEVYYEEKVDLTPVGKKEGYTFLGWSLKKDATNADEEIEVPANDFTVYAIYRKEINAKWILVDKEAGENQKESTSCYKYNNDQTCKIETGTVIPKSEYIMDGWDIVQGGVEVHAANNFYYDIEEDTIFYSITRKKQQLKGIYYYGNDNKIDALASTCILYNGATKCVLTSPLEPYMYKETPFIGWSSDKYTYKEGNMEISSDTTYYAHYVRSVYLNYHTGATNSIKTNTNTVEYILSDVGDHEIIPKYTIIEPDSIDTYETLGWRADDGRSEADDTYKIGATIDLKYSLDLNSVYKRNISLKYETDGGSPVPETSTVTQYYNSISGASNHLHVLPDNVEKRGWTLKGWAEDSLSGTKYGLSYNYYLNKPTVMYAVWERNYYNVTFSGSNITASENPTKVGYGLTKSITLTPDSRYYIESVTCTNGYTISVSTGTGAYTMQTVVLSNNNNLGDSTCTISMHARSYPASSTWVSAVTCNNPHNCHDGASWRSETICTYNCSDGGTRDNVRSYIDSNGNWAGAGDSWTASSGHYEYYCPNGGTLSGTTCVF